MYKKYTGTAVCERSQVREPWNDAGKTSIHTLRQHLADTVSPCKSIARRRPELCQTYSQHSAGMYI